MHSFSQNPSAVGWLLRQAQHFPILLRFRFNPHTKFLNAAFLPKTFIVCRIIVFTNEKKWKRLFWMRLLRASQWRSTENDKKPLLISPQRENSYSIKLKRFIMSFSMLAEANRKFNSEWQFWLTTPRANSSPDLIRGPDARDCLAEQYKYFKLKQSCYFIMRLLPAFAFAKHSQ